MASGKGKKRKKIEINGIGKHSSKARIRLRSKRTSNNKSNYAGNTGTIISFYETQPYTSASVTFNRKKNLIRTTFTNDDGQKVTQTHNVMNKCFNDRFGVKKY